MDANLITIKQQLKDNNLLISIIPPASVKQRTNSNICCVVDVSGSMDNTATITNATNSTENYKLSILDIVKHALKMIINSLTSDDFLSVVTFSSNSTILFDLLPMNDANKSLTIEKVESLRADGGTELWNGLKLGLEVIKNSNNLNKNSSVFLLTDGQPTDQNIQTNLEQFKKANPKLNCTINTFGFSDKCESVLLNKLSKEYNGMFSYIQDGSLIATAFANCLANSLTLFSNTALMQITSLNQTIFEVPASLKVMFNQIDKQGNQKIIIDVGVINTQQTRDFIFTIKKISEKEERPFAEIQLTYTENFNTLEHVKFNPLPRVVVKTLISREETEDNQIFNHIYRFKVIQAIQDSIDKYLKNPTIFGKTVKENLFKLIEEMEEMLSLNDRHFEGIYKDLVRTVSEAFTSQQQFNSWGHHYLLSLMRAHLIQQCNTYKDPGVQHYGQSLFQEIRAAADETFCKLPPPKPYSQATNYDNSNQSSSYSSAYNMNDYHNYSSGGCIHEKSLVYLSNGQKKEVSEIKKGDQILCPALLGMNISAVEVECVVLSKCQSNTHDFVQLGDSLWITPKHPVRLNGEWIYPKQLGEVTQMDAQYIYQFVLKSGHTMNIGGYEVISLGHGFTDSVAQHDYLGSQQVIRDLQKMKGWNEGKVYISSRQRDLTNGQVIAFIQ